MEITGEYWLGVVPIDLNRSTPHFGFFSEFPSAIVAVTKLNENCYNVFTQFLLFLLYLPQDEIRVLSSELMGEHSAIGGGVLAGKSSQRRVAYNVVECYF